MKSERAATWFLIRRPCVVAAQPSPEIAGPPEGDQTNPASASPLNLKASTTRPPLFRCARLSAASGSRRPEVLRRRAPRGRRAVLTDVHETARLRRWRGRDVLQTRGVSCAARRTSSSTPPPRASPSTSRKGSSCRRGRCRTSSTRRAPPATRRSWCESAAFRSATNNLVSDNALAVDPARHGLARWCSTPPTRCSCRAAQGSSSGASASSSGAGARGGSPPSGGAVHGDASTTPEKALFGWSERLAAAAQEPLLGIPVRASTGR